MYMCTGEREGKRLYIHSLSLSHRRVTGDCTNRVVTVNFDLAIFNLSWLYSIVISQT